MLSRVLKYFLWLARLLPGFTLISNYGLLKSTVGFGLFISLTGALVLSRVITNVLVIASLVGTIIAFYIAGILTSYHPRSRKYGDMMAAFGFSVSIGVLTFIVWMHREAVLGVNIFYVPSESMEPALVAGDVILVDSWAYEDTEPKVGEIAVFHLPSTKLVLVKRVVEVSAEHFSAAGDNAAQSISQLYMNRISNYQLRGKVSGIAFNVRRGQDLRLLRAIDENPK